MPIQIKKLLEISELKKKWFVKNDIKQIIFKEKYQMKKSMLYYRFMRATLARCKKIYFMTSTI